MKEKIKNIKKAISSIFEIHSSYCVDMDIALDELCAQVEKLDESLEQENDDPEDNISEIEDIIDHIFNDKYDSQSMRFIIDFIKASKNKK